MGATIEGQRAGGVWGSYSLGEAADAVWRVADELGSAVEARCVHVHMPGVPTELPWVEVFVSESVDAMALRDQFGLQELPGMPTVDGFTCEIDQTLLTIRVVESG